MTLTEELKAQRRDYMRKYRLAHPDYVKKTNARTREQRSTPEGKEKQQAYWLSEHGKVGSKERQRKYRKNHPERVRKAAKKYYQEHPEAQEWQKQYKQRPDIKKRERDRMREKRKDSDMLEAERLRMQELRKNSSYVEKEHKYKHEYRKTPNGRARNNQDSRTRHARKMGAEGRYTIEEWFELRGITGGYCLRCGKQVGEENMTRDHIQALSKKGSNWIENIQPLCKPCNSSKHNKYIDYLTPFLS